MWPYNAYVGQHVVCVDDSPQGNDNHLKRGTVYTIRRIGEDKYWCNHCFWLNEITRGIEPGFEKYGETGYRATRFRPVDESRLDVFRKMLKPVNDYADA